MVKPQGPTNSQLLGAAWGLGWRTAAGLLIGNYLDGMLSTAPLLTLTLALAAMVSGVTQILSLLDRSGQDRGNGPSGPP